MATFRITMKDPDGFGDSIEAAVQEQLPRVEGLNERELEAVRDIRRDELIEACRKWFAHSEYLEVEIDTDAGTCVVVPAT